jgi:hypothetical protein
MEGLGYAVQHQGELDLLESRLVALRSYVDDNYLMLLMPICQSAFMDNQIEHASSKFAVEEGVSDSQLRTARDPVSSESIFQDATQSATCCVENHAASSRSMRVNE